MFKALLRVQFSSLWATLTRNTTGKRKKSTGKAVLVAILFIYILGCFFVMFGGMFYALAEPLSMLGLGWFYFALAGIIAAALCFIGSVFMAQQQLFNAKDNELLLSMPIPPSYILGSRMAALLLVNYAFELVVFIPVGVVWCMKLSVTAMGAVCFVLVCLLLPFLILSFTCLFAWLLALISSRLRFKTVITLVLSLAFLGLYMYAVMNMQNYLLALLESSAQLAGSVEAYAYPAYALGVAIAEGDLVSLIGFAACCILPFAIVCALLSRFFTSVTTKRASVRIKYRRTELKAAGAMSALLKEGVILRDYEEFGRCLKALPKDCVRIFSSGKITAKYFFAAMENIHQRSPFRPAIPDPAPGGTLNAMKAVKNSIELEGFRRAFAEDARALMKVIDWVKDNVNSGITEYQVAMKLMEVRSGCPDYLGESFPAIVAFGANAALPHYVPSETGSAVIRPEGFLLIDTGAQYTYGTTDTTRTIPLGPLTQRQRDDYTVALKGMIDLSMVVFYKGMRGCLLDILARGPIMRAGRMYWHGTQHGIGHNLCVHEGPQSVRMEENPVPLAEGMVMSNEPAVYVEGEYGIRHENAVAVVSHMKNSYGEFLAFETLTYTPIDLSPVNFNLLDKEETAWIEAYNKRAALL